MNFSFTDNGRLKGPAEYMEDRGKDLFSKICDGEDDQFPRFASQSPDIETAVLVRMQTDYADWKGMREVESKMSA